jgi:hypothetical protein
MKVTVVPNRRGEQEVHKAGCQDVRPRSHRMEDALKLDAATRGDVYAAYWDCIADEAVEDGFRDYPTVEHVWWAWRSEFSFKPCTKALPEMPVPDFQEQFLGDPDADDES